MLVQTANLQKELKKYDQLSSLASSLFDLHQGEMEVTVKRIRYKTEFHQVIFLPRNFKNTVQRPRYTIFELLQMATHFLSR